MNKRDPLPIVALVAFVAALGLWFFMSRSEVVLHRSLVGNSGLAVWLKSEGHDVQRYRGGAYEKDSVGLRILPLLDTNLLSRSKTPENQEEYLRKVTERDIQRLVVQRKLRNAPTLVIMPKWIRAVRATGYVHEDLLAPVEDVQRALNHNLFNLGKIGRPDTRVMRIDVDGQEAVLFAPQVFSAVAERCEKLISTGDAALLVRCPRGEGDVWYLSDPDLLNNHGLSLGDNAAIAATLLPEIAKGKRIILDETRSEPRFRLANTPHERTWDDAKRIFAYPFSILWWSAIGLMALLLWRSFVRAAPVRKVFEDQIGASKTVSLAAKARLFRLAGLDSDLMEAHVTERCKAAATTILGPHRDAGNAMLALLRITQRRNPELARDFEAAHNAALAAPSNATQSDLLQRLRAFETQLSQVKHEFGRA